VVLDSDYCDWYFSIGKSKKQYMAIVPGSNINDLVCNKLIPNPYIDDNISKLNWIEDSLFTYVTAFDLDVGREFKYQIVCEGLDTYAEVYLNNQLVLKGNNMFVSYQNDISALLRNGTNLLKIVFKSAVEVGKQKAKLSSISYPADNEEGAIKASPFVRKAAFQFGWDINPRLVSCGIWRPIKIFATLKTIEIEDTITKHFKNTKPFYNAKLEKDELGESFAFYTNEKKPVHTFMYGANYVPYNMYPLPLKNYKRVAQIQKNQGLPNRYEYYRSLFAELKNYGCNMLRVWGGGWYEDDYFYDLADSLHIAVWQDFMFANTMYPGDEDWLSSVKIEVKQNVERIGKHPCIVLWSGNNEIEVAWNNWGWQSKYHYSKQDSLTLITDYKKLFEEIIPAELKLQKRLVKYILSSPISNWGRATDFKKGDNHYWGVWHGEAALEDFNTKVPRFASEYGMPSLNTNSSLKRYITSTTSKPYQNELIWNRMKSYKGMSLLERYINNYLPQPSSDSALSYASRYIQFKALKMAYNAHLYNFPLCSGSLFWQFNESWPGITWAAIDFKGQRKIPPMVAPFALVIDTIYDFKIKSNPAYNLAHQVTTLHITVKDFKGQTIATQQIKCNKNELKNGISIYPKLLFDSLILSNYYIKLELTNLATNKAQIIWDTLIFLQKEKELQINKPEITITKIDKQHLKISTNTLVVALFLEDPNGAELSFDTNFINIEAGHEKIISVRSKENDFELSKIRFYSLYDLKNQKRD